VTLGAWQDMSNGSCISPCDIWSLRQQQLVECGLRYWDRYGSESRIMMVIMLSTSIVISNTNNDYVATEK
jgi:hypothetical protein